MTSPFTAPGRTVHPHVGLNAFQGALDVQWHYILAMTVLTLLPITVVFAFLQRFITSAIATTGMKG